MLHPGDPFTEIAAPMSAHAFRPQLLLVDLQSTHPSLLWEMELPPPKPFQAYCIISALEAGHLSLPSQLVMEPFDPAHPAPMLPSLSFLLLHSTSRQKMLFDLGIRRDVWSLPPGLHEQLRTITTTAVPQTVVESLAKGGLHPDEIDFVAISHLHWDHIGDPNDFRGRTKFILGGESKALLASAYPTVPDSCILADCPPADQTIFLSSGANEPTRTVALEVDAKWEPIGPFPRAYDFYGDGSLYIVDAPGHVPGHINILARTSSDGSWILLAGDSVHHWDILDGRARVAVDVTSYPAFGRCMHKDVAKAEEHIERIKSFRTMERTQVILAHDLRWYEGEKGGNSFFPGSIPPA